jgi:arylsulfatase
MPAGVAANMGNRSFIIEAEINRNKNENGVLLAIGGSNVGLSLFMKDERLVFDYNIFYEHVILESDVTVPEGDVRVGVYLERKDPSGEVTLLINGDEAGKIDLPFVIRILGSTGMDIGRDSLSPVSEQYDAPFPFEGEINQVAVHLPERGDTLEESFLAMRVELGME